MNLPSKFGILIALKLKCLNSDSSDNKKLQLDSNPLELFVSIQLTNSVRTNCDT